MRRLRGCGNARVIGPLGAIQKERPSVAQQLRRCSVDRRYRRDLVDPRSLEAEPSTTTKPKDPGRHSSTHDSVCFAIIILEQMKTTREDECAARTDRDNAVEAKGCREHSV